MRRTVLRRLSTTIVRLDPSAEAEDTGGSLEGLVAQLERAAEDAVCRLEESERAGRRLIAALGEVAQGVVMSDRAGTVVYRNTQAAMFVGARHGEALAERALSELLSAAVGGEAREETIELFSPPRRTLTIRATPLVEGDDVIGAIAVIDDISERRRLEAIRRDFVANISHELKTPVGALSLVAETLEGEDDPEVVARLSHRMRTEAERLGRIIEDLLDLSRIEADETPSREPVSIQLVIAKAVERLRPVADHRSIRLEVDEPAYALAVVGDRRQLVSAVHNLLDNAIKYSESGSTVNVVVRHDGDAIEIEVADHGIGIPSRDLERIFERFYRVDRARSRDTGGTGLGLAIVRHVASNHGGDVRVMSREGAGSTFTLRLSGGTGAPDLQSVGVSKETTRG
jgi:two-component system sensor histidine kinase SenX3